MVSLDAVLKTRQIHLSAIRKVKLKEHGLLKANKELREPLRNGCLSSTICVQGGRMFGTPRRPRKAGYKTDDRESAPGFTNAADSV